MTEITISNSRLNTYKRCPNKYKYKYVLKLKPKKRSVQLERGSWIHELLMVDADGHDWMQRHRLLTQEFNNLWEEEREELGNMPGECGRIMRSYKRHYSDDEHRWHVVDTELDEVVTLPNGVRLRIIIDVVLEDKRDGGLWVRDYKTRKSFKEIDLMMLDPQLTLYYKGLELLGYTDLRGAMYDEIRTKPPTIPALVYRGTRLERKRNMDTDVYTYARAIRKHGFDPSDYADILRGLALRQKDKFFRRTMLPKDPPIIRTTIREAMQVTESILRAERRGHFPRVADDDCRWKCEFKDVCIAELMGGNIEPLIKQNFTRRKEKDH